MAIARDDTPDRLVNASRADEEQGFELKLRPRWLREFIGQSKAKEQLAIALEAAKSRGEALDHVLLFGPPGLGKTTLATIIAARRRLSANLWPGTADSRRPDRDSYKSTRTPGTVSR